MSAEIHENGYEKNNEKVQANGAWITNDFLEEILRKYEENDDIRVLDSNVCAAVGVGDNYLSIIYRTTVEFTRKEGGPVEKRQLMIKGQPTAKFLVEMIEEMGIFKKELAMYNVCLKAMKKISEKVFPNEDFISADCYESPLPNTIIMEDLQISGYKMAHRREQLSFEHAAVLLKSMARFHALSIKVVEKHPEIVTDVAYDFYQESNREKMAPYMDKSIPIWTDLMKSWGDAGQYVPYITKTMKNVYDKILYMVRPDSCPLPVINHGDCWTNNILFKYDSDGNVVHAKFVDFQLSRYSSPALDLLYFLFTSPKADVLTESMFDLIKIYHDALTSDMRKLGLDTNGYSLHDLHEDLRDKSFFGLIVLSTVTPIIIAKPDDAMDLEDFDMETMKNMNEENFPLLKNYRDKFYQKIMEKYLKFMDKIGYLKDAHERLKHVDDFVAEKMAKAEITENNVDLNHISAPQEIAGES